MSLVASAKAGFKLLRRTKEAVALAQRVAALDRRAYKRWDDMTEHEQNLLANWKADDPKLMDCVATLSRTGYRLNALLNTITLCLWKPALYQVATRGAESFYGTPFVPPILPLCQLWIGAGEGLGTIVHCEGGAFAAYTIEESASLNVPVQFGKIIQIEQGQSIPAGKLTASIVAAAKFLQLEIVGTEREALPSKVRREAKKQQQHIPEVITIYLRRVIQKASKGGTREIQHASLVRWHWQAYHTKNGIEPRFKQPYVRCKDKPLLPRRDSVYVAAR